MGSGIATVGRLSYAVGLYWENSPTGRVAQAAKEAANQPGQQADFYALRAGAKDGRIPQFGLGQKIAGHKAGMPAFAPCLANQQPGSWAGAFRLREGTAVIVVRDDLILPDGDQFYASEADARERLLQEIGFGGLQRIYAPEAWSISGADSMPISLLMNERRDVTLRPVVVSQKALVVGAGAAVALAAVIGVGIYMQTSQDEKPVASIGAPTPFETQAPTYPPPEKVWEKAPLPLDFVENCRAGLGKIPVSLLNWSLGNLTCNGKAITGEWSRTKGISGAPDGVKVNDTASSAPLKVDLPDMTPRGSQDLLNQDDITRRYMLQDWPGTIARTQDDPPPPPPPGYSGPWTPPPAPWVKRSFTLNIPVLPASVPVFLGDLPGAVITSMTYAPSGGGGWMIEGVIYENRDDAHH